MTQLALTLQPRRVPPRQTPIIERLRAVLNRAGIDWRYRALKGSVLLRPLLGVRFGWQPMCGFYCCGELTFERREGYCEPRPPIPHDEIVAFANERRAHLYELWGAP